jgi:hypothetical protein
MRLVACHNNVTPIICFLVLAFELFVNTIYQVDNTFVRVALLRTMKLFRLFINCRLDDLGIHRSLDRLLG